MQTEIILQDLPFLIQQETEKLSAELGKTLSFREFEDAVMKLMYQIASSKYDKMQIRLNTNRHLFTQKKEVLEKSIKK